MTLFKNCVLHIISVCSLCLNEVEIEHHKVYQQSQLHEQLHMWRKMQVLRKCKACFEEQIQYGDINNKHSSLQCT